MVEKERVVEQYIEDGKELELLKSSPGYATLLKILRRRQRTLFSDFVSVESDPQKVMILKAQATELMALLDEIDVTVRNAREFAHMQARLLEEDHQHREAISDWQRDMNQRLVERRQGMGMI